MSKTVAVTDATFDETVVGPGALTLVDFWAPWCGPCQFMNPVLDELASKHDGALPVAKLNIDDNEETAQRFGVRSIPTLVLFHEGQEIGRHVGAMPAAQLQEWLSAHAPQLTAAR